MLGDLVAGYGPVERKHMFFRFGGGNEPVRSLLHGLDMAPLAAIFVMMDPIIIAGTCMEWIANAYITVPIFAPVVAGFGFEPVRFGMPFVVSIRIDFPSQSFARPASGRRAWRRRRSPCSRLSVPYFRSSDRCW